MGSFGSTRKHPSQDTDYQFCIPENISRNDLWSLCCSKTPRGEKLLERSILSENAAIAVAHITPHIRILQWNVLSQSLALHCDKFVKCPAEGLNWDNRKYLMLQELIRCSPGIMCLQEVDHFNLLKKVLLTQGYKGYFLPKPDSPCVYIEDNNGPDGCAIFYDVNKFYCKEVHCYTLKIWNIHSNQVALAVILKHLDTDKEFCVVSTHLKARRGALLTRLRDEQARDLLDFAHRVSKGRPLIICGDFNGEPNEPFYRTMQMHQNMGLQSAYASYLKYYYAIGKDKNRELKWFELPFTTSKIRESGEETHTHDYIFLDPDRLRVLSVLNIPTVEELGNNRLPSCNYPSDHMSLMIDLVFQSAEHSPIEW